MHINIDIAAKAGSGKSIITSIIAKALREQGFDVNIATDIDYSSEELLSLADNENKIDSIKDTRTINLSQTQLHNY